MECNKEEAFRAMQIAETRMQSNDFAGALRFAQKAQRLFPQLENIAQMLAVCEVHCAGEKKLGSEADWYAVLKIETSADETTIKKQYRKLALLLHPDKNKFSGSEAAFKLIGEANGILADKGKRSLYDVIRKSSVTVPNQSTAADQSSQNTSFSRQSRANFNPGNASSSRNPDGSQHQQAKDEAFLTMCPFCESTYHYSTLFLHKALLCQNCKKSFFAFKLDPSGKTAWSQKASMHQKDVPNGGSSKDNHGRNPPSKTKCDTGSNGGAKVQADANIRMHAKPKSNGHGIPKTDPMKVKPQDKGDMKSGGRKKGRNCPTDGGAKVQADAKVHMHAKPKSKGSGVPKTDPVKVKPQDKGDMKRWSKKGGRNCPTDSNLKRCVSRDASTHQKDVPNGGSSKDNHGRNHLSKSKCDTGSNGGAKVQADAKVRMHAKPENRGHGAPKTDPMKVKPRDKETNWKWIPKVH